MLKHPSHTRTTIVFIICCTVVFVAAIALLAAPLLAGVKAGGL